MVNKQIGGYHFEQISEKDYRITYPDGHTEVKYYLAAESLMKRVKEQAHPTNKITNQIFSPNSPAYLKLQVVALTLSAFVTTHEFAISNCALDINAGTGWTTIVCRKKSDNNSGYMLFTPSDQEELLNTSYTEFSKILSKYISSLKKHNDLDKLFK